MSAITPCWNFILDPLKENSGISVFTVSFFCLSPLSYMHLPFSVMGNRLEYWWSQVSEHQNHRENLLKHRLPGPSPGFPIQWVWEWDFSFLNTSRVMQRKSSKTFPRTHALRTTDLTHWQWKVSEHIVVKVMGIKGAKPPFVRRILSDLYQSFSCLPFPIAGKSLMISFFILIFKKL